ncbi:MAG TPA: hypothetical protein VN999_20415 [Thermoanaerobaculia bacterium]|nr:hypothetical protein [Thermoanaerobaculia bacterium]
MTPRCRTPSLDTHHSLEPARSQRPDLDGGHPPQTQTSTRRQAIKKTVRKLQLSRETLHTLMLAKVAGDNPSIYPYCTANGYCTVTCARNCTQNACL